jgi:hypothetical protein
VVRLVDERAVAVGARQQPAGALGQRLEHVGAEREIRRDHGADTRLRHGLAQLRLARQPSRGADHERHSLGREPRDGVERRLGGREIDRHVDPAAALGGHAGALRVGRAVEHVRDLGAVAGCERFDEPPHPSASDEEEAHRVRS